MDYRVRNASMTNNTMAMSIAIHVIVALGVGAGVVAESPLC